MAQGTSHRTTITGNKRKRQANAKARKVAKENGRSRAEKRSRQRGNVHDVGNGPVPFNAVTSRSRRLTERYTARVEAKAKAEAERRRLAAEAEAKKLAAEQAKLAAEEAAKQAADAEAKLAQMQPTTVTELQPTVAQAAAEQLIANGPAFVRCDVAAPEGMRCALEQGHDGRHDWDW